MNRQNAEQLEQDPPAYLADYGLNQVPFSDTHEDRFLYLDPERAQRLNLIQHTIQYNNLLLIVRGKPGVGKTSLMRRLVSKAASDVQICVVTANPMMDAGQLLYQAAKGFDVRKLPLDSGDLQGLLYEHIANLHHQGRIPILVVDDAHTLPKDALLTLYTLADVQVAGEQLLRIMLFCTPQIDKVLGSRDLRALRERVTHNMEIPPLDDITTAEYLKHRLAVAGFTGGSPFTPNMVRRIYKASGGYPARINQIALELLDRGVFDREEKDGIVRDSQPTRSRPYRRVFAILVAAVALALFVRYRLSHVTDSKPVSQAIPVPAADAQTPQITSEISPAPSAHVTHAEPAATETSDPGNSANQASSESNTVSSSPEQPDAGAVPASQVERKIIPLHPTGKPSTEPGATTASVPAADETQAQDLPADGAQQATTAPGVAQQEVVAPSTVVAKPEVHVASIEPSPVPASKREQTVVLHGSGFTRDSRVYVSWADHDQEIPPQRVKYVSAQQLEVSLTVGTGDQHWEIRVNDSRRGNSNSLRFNVKSQQKPQHLNDWVLAQDPNAVTLQLFGSHEQRNVEAFIQQHQLDKQAHYFLAKHNGEDWYSVVYGVYTDQAGAQSAINTLPASLSRIKPWVRRFDDIQSGIAGSPPATAATSTTVVKRPSTELASHSVPPRDADVNQYESWIWSQDPSRFTLQLMGAHDEASIRKFISRYPDLAGNLVYFHSRHNGSEWYTVIYGVYKDKQKAGSAIRRLPSALQKTTPWIRKFASIHAELSRPN